jgi:phosphoserine phosphatase
MVVPPRALSKISLVLADVDGTLVTAEKVLTSRARAAVKALQAADIQFAITSGWPPRGMSMRRRWACSRRLRRPFWRGPNQ